MMFINSGTGKPPSKLVLTYTALLLTGATIFTGTNWRWAEILFIDKRDYPGGPSVAFYDLFFEPANVISNIAMFFDMALVESLLLWRLYIIWHASKWVMVVPILWFLATVGVSCETIA